MNKVCETNTKLINVVSSSVFTKNVAVGCQNFKGAEDTKKNHGSAQTAVRLSIQQGRRAPNTRWHVTHTTNLSNH